MIHENQSTECPTSWENGMDENEDGSLLRTKAGKTHSEDVSDPCVASSFQSFETRSSESLLYVFLAIGVW